MNDIPVYLFDAELRPHDNYSIRKITLRLAMPSDSSQAARAFTARIAEALEQFSEQMAVSCELVGLEAQAPTGDPPELRPREQITTDITGQEHRHTDYTHIGNLVGGLPVLAHNGSPGGCSALVTTAGISQHERWHTEQAEHNFGPGWSEK